MDGGARIKKDFRINNTVASRDVTDMVKNIRLSPKNEDEAIAFSD